MVSGPLLLFPNTLSVIALILVPGLWLARLVTGQQRASNKVPGAALAGLLLMTCISLYPSVDLNLSRPKLYGLILGFYVFSLAVQYAYTPRRREVLLGALSVSGVAVSLVSLVAVKWNLAKFPFLDPFYWRLPHLISRIQTSSSLESGVHPNEVGGVLALLLPIVAALMLFGVSRRKRALTGLAMAVIAGTLILTGSRSAWIGVGLAFLVLALLRWPRLVVVAPVIGAAVAMTVLTVGPERLVQAFSAIDAGSGSSAISRFEVWSRALEMIQDFPYTGIGLNTFPVVLSSLYPPIRTGLPHAHNLFLQTAIDLGLLGLVCFVILWVFAAFQLIHSWRSSAANHMATAAIGAGLLGHLVYSQTDAVALGAKPAILLWAVLGGAVALRPVSNCSGVWYAWMQWSFLVVACGLGVLIMIFGMRTLPI